MYTGIVHGAYPLTSVVRKPGLHQFLIELPPELLEELNIGASVGLDGVCMTVTEINGNQLSFDAMQETLKTTTLGGVDVGDLVNVERSAKQGAEIGGHNISGHVDGCAEIIAIEQTENNCTLHFRLPPQLTKYVFKKGFVGVNGCSLTVADFKRDEATFSVCLIPETLRVTNLGQKSLGDWVNIEVDRQTQVIVDTVERVLAERADT
ncbi:riboflavin synthase subunit alpha [Zhongshania borealis]|uniref:Riboflavin synthase n=1 Tax=Zhongshania borealis TaxID=889488 RepID=A0ABP7X541_9GAMM